ncbi:gamma-glutamyl-gamma-aminobutyrate hydrolase family protein [Bacillus horti]|uniref:Glutamine amidotransferase n=1 Tax=Caldalkalibacillus horti TaxID=77523 RepID=A0ABT9VWQ1_9BACI|nr:gamma-glutamyl-gamma-aminobutyrate hydrolase family protein [Bacillus horti]MDQ0165427.1 putative glutamine amidotransferase [Bacillus horti]
MRKPLIGLTASFEQPNRIFITRHYSDWIERVGGLPVIVPYTNDVQQLKEYTTLLDGLLLSGGGDIDPTLFQEEPHPQLGSILPERDTLEIVLAQEMLRLDLPILAICRGIQILNIAAGGTMYQDLQGQYNGELIQHQQKAPTSHVSHTVDVLPESKLADLLQTTQLKTNSFHHQAVKDPAPHFKATAYSRDGVIEAIESDAHQFVLGVQWHPECMPKEHASSERIFTQFVQACSSKIRV